MTLVRGMPPRIARAMLQLGSWPKPVCGVAGLGCLLSCLLCQLSAHARLVLLVTDAMGGLFLYSCFMLCASI